LALLSTVKMLETFKNSLHLSMAMTRCVAKEMTEKILNISISQTLLFQQFPAFSRVVFASRNAQKQKQILSNSSPPIRLLLAP
jgi:hypothetical protein